MSPTPHATQPLRAAGTLTRRVDPATGIIIVEGDGMWSNEIAAAHFTELAALVALSRRQLRPVRVLVDLGTTKVQTSTVAQSIQEQAERLYIPGDRIAIVVTSPLLAMQMRRVGGRAEYRHFASRPDAFDWLNDV